MVHFAPFNVAAFAFAALVGSVVSADQLRALQPGTNETEIDTNVTTISINVTDTALNDTLGLVTVDEVILTDPDLTTLAAAFNVSGLVGVLCTNCNYTVFAPVNDAFSAIDEKFLAKLLTPNWILHLIELLSFHATQPTEDRVLSTDLTDGTVLTMLNNETITLGVDAASSTITITSEYTEGSMVVEGDLIASNGNVHKVDAVLLPEFVGTSLVGLANTSLAEDFTILFGFFEDLNIGALIVADYTIFAPTDTAFEALGAETLASLKDPSNQAMLTSILVNHVVEGVYPSVLVQDGASLKGIAGYNMAFMVDGDSIMVNDANVVATDQLANNGIVHAIDKVLMKATAPTASAPTASAPTASAPTASAPTSDIKPIAVPTPVSAPVAAPRPVAAPVKPPTTTTSAASTSSATWLAAAFAAVYAVVTMA